MGEKIPPHNVFVTNWSSKDLRTPDHHKAYDFLCGRPQGLVQRRDYFEPGGGDEAIARDALLRLLRSDEALPNTIRRLLADLIDPAAHCERKITIGFRGHQPLDRAMAWAVGSYFEFLRKQDVPYKQVVWAIKENFGIGETQISKYRREYDKLKVASPQSPPR
jgi:hypothetical protein